MIGGEKLALVCSSLMLVDIATSELVLPLMSRRCFSQTNKCPATWGSTDTLHCSQISKSETAVFQKSESQSLAKLDGVVAHFEDVIDVQGYCDLFQCHQTRIIHRTACNSP